MCDGSCSYKGASNDITSNEVVLEEQNGINQIIQIILVVFDIFPHDVRQSFGGCH